MSRDDAIKKLKELGLEVFRHERGVSFELYLDDTLLEEVVRIVELNEKIDNS